MPNTDKQRVRTLTSKTLTPPILTGRDEQTMPYSVTSDIPGNRFSPTQRQVRVQRSLHDPVDAAPSVNSLIAVQGVWGVGGRKDISKEGPGEKVREAAQMQREGRKEARSQQRNQTAPSLLQTGRRRNAKDASQAQLWETLAHIDTKYISLSHKFKQEYS